MYRIESAGLEGLIVAAAGRSALANSLHMMLEVGGESGDGRAAGHQGGAARQATNLYHLKRCRTITNQLRTAAMMGETTITTSGSSPTRNGNSPAADAATPYEAYEAAEASRISRYARLAEVLATSPQAPALKYAYAEELLGKLGTESALTDDVFEVALVLLTTRLGAATILHGAVSIPVIHARAELGAMYLLGNNNACASAQSSEGLGALERLDVTAADADARGAPLGGVVSAKPHLHAKLLLVEAIALVGSDAKRAHGRAKAALDVAERIYTAATGLGWYQLAAAVTGGSLEGDHQRTLNAVDVCIAGGGGEASAWALIPLLERHCEALLRADKHLRAPAVANARKRLLAAVRGAATKAELDAIEHRLQADALALDDRSRTLKLAVVRQCDHICGICEAWLGRALHDGSSTAALAGLVALIGSRAALRVERTDLARRFAHCADTLLAPPLGPSHPIVAANRITLGSMALFKANGTRYAIIRTSNQLLISPAPPLDVLAAAGTALTKPPPTDACMALVEATLMAILAKDTPTSRDFGPLLACIAALHEHYEGVGALGKELQLLALWADALADFVGPQHSLTLAKMDEYLVKRRAILPPHFHPAGGVVPLLTAVTLTTDTPDDYEVYYAYDGDVPMPREGVNSSELYSGPITLDRVGTVVMKATTFRGEGRSSCTEARFVVTPL